MKKLSLIGTLFLAGSLLFHPGKATIQAQKLKKEPTKTTQTYKPTQEDYINNLVWISSYCNGQFISGGNGIFLSPTNVLTANHVIDHNCNGQLDFKFYNKDKELTINSESLLLRKLKKYDLAGILLPSIFKFTNISPIEIYTGFLDIDTPITMIAYEKYKPNSSTLAIQNGKIESTSQKFTVCGKGGKNCFEVLNQSETNIPTVPGNSGGILLAYNNKLVGIIVSLNLGFPSTSFSPLQNLTQDLKDPGYIGSDGYYYPSKNTNHPISCNLHHIMKKGKKEKYISCKDLKNNKSLSPTWVAQNYPHYVKRLFP